MRRYRPIIPRCRWAALAFTLAVLATISDGQNMTSFMDAANGVHMLYIGNDGHVHELSAVCPQGYCPGQSWSNQDLTAQTGGPDVGHSPLTSFTDSVGAHVFYVDNSNNIDQLFWNGTNWANQDFGVLSGGKALTGYSNERVEKVFYETSDQHLHLLTANELAGSWTNADLTLATVGALAVPGGPLTSFIDTYGDHLFYTGTNGHIYQMLSYWASVYVCKIPGTVHQPPSGCHFTTELFWVNQDLTAQTGGALSEGTALSSVSDSTGEHVVYFGANQHVYDLYFNGSTWVDQDFMGVPGVGWPAPGYSNGVFSGLTSGADSFGSGFDSWSSYIGSDQRVYLIIFKPGFSPPGYGWDLTLMTQLGANVPSSSSLGLAFPCGGLQLTGFASGAGYDGIAYAPFLNLFYVADDGHVHAMMVAVPAGFPHIPIDEDLTGGQPAGSQPMGINAGFCLD